MRLYLENRRAGSSTATFSVAYTLQWDRFYDYYEPRPFSAAVVTVI